ncbi:MAG: NAD(P)/FAD-dependent oxidoreductase [Bacillota bacterium]|nr:NAD(P)/FAD-dependent oxidoreductase [Bacillota bacterium]
MNIKRINRELHKRFGDRVNASFEDNCILLRGELDEWSEVVEAGQMAAIPKGKIHVVNDILCSGAEAQEMHISSLRDDALEGETPDVLIIGGGISGCSIAREMARYKLDILLLEKEADLALGASGRNDGEVHPGVDLSKGSLKHKYVRRGNAMYDEICRDLSVPFKRVGQYACFKDKRLKPIIWCYAQYRRIHDGISDTRIASSEEIKKTAPRLNKDFAFAISNPNSGSVSPYNLTIAYADNAVENGARISLNTAVLGMETENGKIISVETNRGTIRPKIVINAAGVWSDKIAEMAGDRFFTIHPRRGTNSILDKKCGDTFATIASVVGVKTAAGKSHTKGGGILHTAHDNLLIGPDAVETYERENTATTAESIERVFSKQKITMPTLSEREIITYFTGVRAPTYEEDFIIEWGRKTENIFHVAGIQSPGLTTAPAVAVDVSAIVAEKLGAEKNGDFNPVRKAIPVLNEMSDEERAKLIEENPDYGIIICRCEEISKGEILDALRSPVCVPTLDGIKKRVRPGMGRCQGGFCSPLVTKIIAQELGIPVTEVRKSSLDAPIVFESRKGEKA